VPCMLTLRRSCAFAIFAFLAVPTAGCNGSSSSTETLDSGVIVQHTANDCVAFTLSPAAFACGSDQDCTLIEVANACPGSSVCCANTALNNAAGRDITEELQPLQTGPACPCAPLPQQARCVSGQCTIVSVAVEGGDAG
jgi:hypothetical protein